MIFVDFMMMSPLRNEHPNFFAPFSWRGLIVKNCSITTKYRTEYKVLGTKGPQRAAIILLDVTICHGISFILQVLIMTRR